MTMHLNDMDMTAVQIYGIPVALLAFFDWRFLRFRMVKARLPELLKQGAVVIDVRSAQEFAAAASPGSINIPLSELGKERSCLDREKPVVVCCASGTRSAAARMILRKNGFKVVLNAGPWTDTVV